MAEEPLVYKFKHVLIVGGTGMLKEASLQLMLSAKRTTLLARTCDSLEHLRSLHPKTETLSTIAQDYAKSDECLHLIKNEIEQNRPCDLALLWIHSAGKLFEEKLKCLLIKHNENVRIFKLYGSGSKTTLHEFKSQLEKANVDQVRSILLGSIQQNNKRRWLTHQEISEGTLQAIENDDSLYVIGEVG